MDDRHPDLGPELLPLPLPALEEVPKEKPPVVVSREDRLEAELLTAQMQNISLQLQLMQGEMNKALEGRTALMKKMAGFRESFQAKYGADLAQISIKDDGTIVPGAAR